MTPSALRTPEGVLRAPPPPCASREGRRASTKTRQEFSVRAETLINTKLHREISVDEKERRAERASAGHSPKLAASISRTQQQAMMTAIFFFMLL